MSDKYHYQNQQQKSDISHVILMCKSSHTSCCLQIVPTRFLSSVDYNDKEFHTQKSIDVLTSKNQALCEYCTYVNHLKHC